MIPKALPVCTSCADEGNGCWVEDDPKRKGAGAHTADPGKGPTRQETRQEKLSAEAKRHEPHLKRGNYVRQLGLRVTRPKGVPDSQVQILVHHPKLTLG